MRKPAPTGADARPRIYLWTQGYGPRWSIGPNHPHYPAKTIGDALEQALASVGHVEAVIFFQPQTASGVLAARMGAEHE